MPPHHSHPGLRAIALFKASKSLFALIAGLWLGSVVGHDVHAMAVSAAGHLHLDPGWPVTQYLISKAAGISDANIWFFVATFLAYALVHGAEAYGLWHEFLWAEWFTLCSGAIYIPLELHSMMGGVTWINFGLLLVSLAITGYIGWLLYHARKRRREA
jgi:uncharacterized membrane protein (DUF2068 family)